MSALPVPEAKPETVPGTHCLEQLPGLWVVREVPPAPNHLTNATQTGTADEDPDLTLAWQLGRVTWGTHFMDPVGGAAKLNIF